MQSQQNVHNSSDVSKALDLDWTQAKVDNSDQNRLFYRFDKFSLTDWKS